VGTSESHLKYDQGMKRPCSAPKRILRCRCGEVDGCVGKRDVKIQAKSGPNVSREDSKTRATPATCTRDHTTATTSHVMVKTYKEQKEAWVSGHTGSSVADVNSVSLAMPVQYTNPQLRLRARLTTITS